MSTIIEINAVDRLATFRKDWDRLLAKTPAATFFHSYEFLETYWRHFGNDKKFRIILIIEDNSPVAIVPFIVQHERSKVGDLRVLTYPISNWGSFYGPVGSEPAKAISLAINHIRQNTRDWDMIELRWIDTRAVAPEELIEAMHSAGLRASFKVWNQTSAVDFSQGWNTYLAGRKGIWLRRMRQTEERISRQGKIAYLRCRPKGVLQCDADPHWDVYDICENIAKHSWQATAQDGTTMSHESIRSFLRELHASAAAAGMVDMNLLFLDDRPAAFIYGYQYNGNVYGLRRGFDTSVSQNGLGSILLWKTLQDSAQRGDMFYDMGIGSLESKRHFQNCLLPIYRVNHFPAAVLRSQLLRVGRWVKR
jgi:CelD/BcsL family acetyltransferase involved in cellulose biosynthesis